MIHEYVERRDEGYYVASSRVSLASIVLEFKGGASPESIREEFPTFSLEQIYGSIAFYLGHEAETDVYLKALEQKWDELERGAKPIDPDLHRKLEQARKRPLTKQG